VFGDPTTEFVTDERLVALLGLLTSLMRVVLIADDLEGFSSDETGALRFASFIGALRQSVDRLEVIVSINQDVWESAFIPRLSGGLADRLSEVVIELEPLNREAKIAILDSRAPGDGEKILGEMDSESIPSHGRGLIRQAAELREGQKAAVDRAESPAQEVVPPVEASKPEETAPPVEEIAQAEPAPSGAAMPDLSPGAVDQNMPSEPILLADTSSYSPPVPDLAVDSIPSSPSDTPLSWPAPEVSESNFSKPPEPTPEPSAEFAPQADVSAEPPAREPVAEESPPLSPSPFEAAPPLSDLNDVSQAAPTEAEKDESTGSTTDRVDDLLKQFRERYGKN
jgi:hypothetical protein